MWQKISYPTSFFWQKTEKSLLVCSLLLLCSLVNDKIFKVCLQTFFHQPKNKDSYYKRIIVVEKAKLFFLCWASRKKKLRRQDFAALLAFPSTLNYLHTLFDFMENMDNFEARMERVNFGLFQSNSDFTWPNLTL